MGTLSLEDKIAQMIMVQAYSNMGDAHRKNIARLVSRHHVGGVAFFQGDPLSQALLTNHYQEKARIPLLVALDGENGLGMRLDHTIRYPSQMALGAITDASLVYHLGRDMAAQMRRLGVHLNFAPVADVNINPANPVINTRSFGEDPQNVAEKVVSIMQGMQDGGLLVAAKHFPGHGDTGSDSHHSLPVLVQTRQRLDRVELLPFREAISRGLTGIMVAHLQVPALDPRENRPATVSAMAVDSLLKNELGFRGLVITDALNMKGLSRYYEPGRREVEAVKAGNDILLMPADVGLAVSEIKRAVRQGEISEQRIEVSCRKILQAKYWAGLHTHRPVDTTSLHSDLHLPAYETLHRRLIGHSLTLVRNRDELLPLRDLPGIRLATVTISRDGRNHFGDVSDLFMKGDHFTIRKDAPGADWDQLANTLETYNTIVVNLLNTNSYASRNFGITEQAVDFIQRLNSSESVILNLAGYPYAAGRFADLDRVDALILSYEDDPVYQEYTVQAVFGGRRFSGRLPVGCKGVAEAGFGIYTGPPVRLGYAEPLDAGMDPDTLAELEAIIAEAIREKAMPGCQVLVARYGKVVWNKAYGTHTYRKKKAVTTSDLYDLASITKIASTVPALMRLRQQGRFHEDSLLGRFMQLPDSCDKADLCMADILAHQAGLPPWIPFYQNLLEPLDHSQALTSFNWSPQYSLQIGPSEYGNRDVVYRDSSFTETFSPDYPVRVADHLYMRKSLRDTMYRMICEAELLDSSYRYSDLGYYFFHRIIEEASDTLLYPYVWHHFYAPLGAETLGYLPLNRFPRERIVPTENDLFFRRQLLHGHVHDPGAAMLGGIAGHAGLFGSAHDLAKMMQMYLNGGTYGGDRYIDPEVLIRYTSRYSTCNGNRRGLGFDRPLPEEETGEGPTCGDASPVSFGHSGFTGTIAWVDPAYQLVYVFLSNRIHPNQGNTRLIEDNVRTRIQQVIYDALTD